MFQLQFIILKRGLCRDQLIAVGADLCFQLGIVAPGDASRIQQLLAAVPLGFGYLQGVFVHLHRLGRIQYLYVGLGDGLPDVILRSSHVEVRHPVVEFFLLDGLQAFAAVVYGPLCIQPVVSVVGCLVAALQHFRSADDAARLLIGTVHQILAAGE